MSSSRQERGEAKKRKLDPVPAHNENIAGLNIVAGSYSNEQWLVEAPQVEKIRGSERGIRGGSEGIRVTSSDDGS